MQKKLYTDFNKRQYMQAPDYEIFYYNDKNLDHVSPHSHDYYEFYFFMEGDVTYMVDGNTYPFAPGDYLLIPPGLPHYPIFAPGSKTYRRFVLWISKEYYEELCGRSSDFSYSFDYVQQKRSYRFRTDFITYQNIQGKLLDMIEEKNSSKPFGDINMQLMLSSFLIQLNRITYDIANQIKPEYRNVLYLNICDYINRHLADDLSLDFLSEFFYVSKYHISHTFKENMGISLHQYILSKRLQACKNGILSGMPFAKVVEQYGFGDYTSFYRAFKKEYGVSPKEFKKQNKLPEDFIE